MSYFRQNPHFAEILKATRHSILVESSPFDRTWGSGLQLHDKLSNYCTPTKVKTYVPAAWRRSEGNSVLQMNRLLTINVLKIDRKHGYMKAILVLKHLRNPGL